MVNATLTVVCTSRQKKSMLFLFRCAKVLIFFFQEKKWKFWNPRVQQQTAFAIVRAVVHLEVIWPAAVRVRNSVHIVQDKPDLTPSVYSDRPHTPTGNMIAIFSVHRQWAIRPCEIPLSTVCYKTQYYDLTKYFIYKDFPYNSFIIQQQCW